MVSRLSCSALPLASAIRTELGDLILIEQFPKLEGRQMIMMIAPGKKKIAAKPAPEMPVSA